nr:hypothetical protein [Tanacetum cinerariifolium]
MASFDYRLIPLYPIKECSSCGSLYTKDYCCSEGSLGDKIICDLDKTPDLSQRSPQNCPKCENPVDDSSEPSNDNTNVANALQELFVVEQDPSENSSQNPPKINHYCCYGCGDPLEDIFCHQCTCELCGKGAHYVYNCPPKFSVVPDPKPFNNQTVDELPQTLPSFDPTCYYEDGNSFTYDSRSNLVHDSPNVFNPPLQPPTYSCEFCRNDAYYGHDCSLQVLSPAWETILEIKLAFEDKHCQPEDILELFRRLHNDVQNIHEELAVYINAPNWDRPTICYDDDDEDYAIAVTPSLSTEEPDNSLNQFEDFFDSNDGSTLTDDDSFSIDNIEYVETSPFDSELVSSEVMEIVIPDVGGIKDDILLTIKDDILREKLLNVNLLVANIESLNDNPSPSFNFKTKSSSTSLNSLLEKTNTFDNSLLEFKTFCFDLEEISSGSTTTHSDISLPEYEAFYDDHVKEISSGKTTTHSNSSLYDSFIFDLSINSFPPVDRSDFYEFANELAHIIFPPDKGSVSNKYNELREENASKNHQNDDTSICEHQEANSVQYEGYQSQNSHDSYSHQSHHDPNDSEKSLTELNNDARKDLEDFKRCVCSMRTIHDKLYDRDDGKTTGVLPNKESKTINQEPQPQTDFEKLMTKFLDGQRVTNMFFKNNANDMIIKMKQNENNFQTKIKNMERKINVWSESQTVSSNQTDRTDPPPPPQAQTEHVNAVFTGIGKSDDPPKIQTPPPIIVNNKSEKDRPIKTSKRNITW